jgi:hypothetical protein
MHKPQETVTPKHFLTTGKRVDFSISLLMLEPELELGLLIIHSPNTFSLCLFGNDGS